MIGLRCGCEYHLIASKKTFKIFPSSCYEGDDTLEFRIKIKSQSDILEVEKNLLNNLWNAESGRKFEKDMSVDDASFQNRLIDELNSEIANLKRNHDKLKHAIENAAEQKSITSSFPDPFGILENVEQWVHKAFWIAVLIIIVISFVMVVFLLCKFYGLVDQMCRCGRQNGARPQQWN